ncbi:hypothetical protein BDW72DRAFT_74686 [Aspergillus terricola var. indicus]
MWSLPTKNTPLEIVFFRACRTCAASPCRHRSGVPSLPEHMRRKGSVDGAAHLLLSITSMDSVDRSISSENPRPLPCAPFLRGAEDLCYYLGRRLLRLTRCSLTNCGGSMVGSRSRQLPAHETVEFQCVHASHDTPEPLVYRCLFTQQAEWARRVERRRHLSARDVREGRGRVWLRDWVQALP